MSLFAEQVYNLIKQIPKGRVISYSEIAQVLGKPRAVRAIGNILNKNKKLIKLPCHRIVRKNGLVGGYAGGISLKIRILKNEGIEIKKGKIDMNIFSITAKDLLI